MTHMNFQTDTSTSIFLDGTTPKKFISKLLGTEGNARNLSG